MAQSERTTDAMNEFWRCLEELIKAHQADKLEKPPQPPPSKWEGFWKNLHLFVGIPSLIVVLLMASFALGEDHQKEIGPHGRECTDRTLRQPGTPGGAAECRNGFWFQVPPEVFPRDKLEQK
jgi:hypothetical protein